MKSERRFAKRQALAFLAGIGSALLFAMAACATSPLPWEHPKEKREVFCPIEVYVECWIEGSRVNPVTGARIVIFVCPDGSTLIILAVPAKDESI